MYNIIIVLRKKWVRGFGLIHGYVLAENRFLATLKPVLSYLKTGFKLPSCRFSGGAKCQLQY